MLSLLRRRTASAVPAQAANDEPGVIDAQALVVDLSGQASTLGRETAEVRGAIEDANRHAAEQVQTLARLVTHLGEIDQAQDAIAARSSDGMQSVQRVREAVSAVGDEVAAIVQTLREVSAAAAQITQIALQTRLVAFNATVEAKRAGDAGRGFGVVAEAVKDLATRVESSSKAIAGTVARLDARIDTLAGEIASRPGETARGAVHVALAEVEGGVERIGDAAQRSHAVCNDLSARIEAIEREMQGTIASFAGSLAHTERLLEMSEHMIQVTSASGIETVDTPYVAASQDAAARIGASLEQALRERRIGVDELFDERYVPIAGSAPAQHSTRFCALADALFPALQEPMLKLSDKVVFGIAADRNGFIACHNARYNHPQRAGDLAWNTANCRNRRIFNDRTGLRSARNTQPFLLQTYRRDMGGGNFVVMKEVAAPITVAGRHWGGLRLAYRF
jgi:methyl-accepting chemotaxis protein